MAKVNLKPIGSALSSTDTENLAQMHALEQKLDEKRAKTRLGWGEKYQQRVRDKKKMTTWERLVFLADDPSLIFPIGTFVNDGETFGEGPEARTSPSAGVITAMVQVKQRWVMVIANDNTVASGSWWPRTPEKIIRAQSIALKLKLPVVYLVDCSGLFLPEQSRSFPGRFGAGRIFKMNSELSDAGVPQVAGVFGDCIAGGGYMPLISDKVYMTEQAYMVIAGAALIQGAKSQNLSSLDIGGASVHVHLSNCADFRVPDDQTCLEQIQNEVDRLASSAVDYYRNAISPSSPGFDTQELSELVPVKLGATYDVRQVIARLVDDSLFGEFWPNVGQELITGVARISGLYVGIVANVQELFDHPQKPGQKRPGGILYKEGVAKLATFSRACNDDGIPMVWLQDVSGFDVGAEAEKQGLLGYGSSLIYANSTNTTPMITVLLRKASGAGYYAMAGLPYEPVLQLATPISRLAVMDGRTLAMGAFNSRIKDRVDVEAGMRAVQDRIEADMDPYKAARQMDVDEVVKLGEIRAYLTCMAEACYQSQGARRIKNPRIWSLHDLQVLQEFSGVEHDSKAAATSTSSQKKKTEETDLKNAFVSPMEGLFYLKPAANEPDFVQAGDEIHPGQTVGLIEVMKCFYPIRYEGDKPQHVASIEVQNGVPVQTGTVLFRFAGE